MTKRMEAIREVFGVPDVFTIRPVTYGEINPVVEMKKDLEELNEKTQCETSDGKMGTDSTPC